MPFLFSSGGSSGGGGVSGGITTSGAVQSAPLANSASTQTTTTLAESFTLLSITVSGPCRVRVYANTDAQSADLNRPIGTDPAEDAGVLLDYVAPSAGTYDLSPLVHGTSDGPEIPCTMTNTNSAAATLTVAFTFVPMEA